MANTYCTVGCMCNTSLAFMCILTFSASSADFLHPSAGVLPPWHGAKLCLQLPWLLLPQIISTAPILCSRHIFYASFDGIVSISKIESHDHPIIILLNFIQYFYLKKWISCIRFISAALVTIMCWLAMMEHPVQLIIQLLTFSAVVFTAQDSYLRQIEILRAASAFACFLGMVLVGFRS